MLVEIRRFIASIEKSSAWVVIIHQPEAIMNHDLIQFSSQSFLDELINYH